MITDENLKGDVDYLTLKPLASDEIDMLLQIKNMVASNKFKCVLHRPSGGNKSLFVAPMEELENSNFNINEDLSVFPNPVNNWLTISGFEGEEKVKLELFDLTGSLVHSYLLNNGKEDYKTNLEYLDKGIYLLRLEGNNTTHTFKIIKK